MGLSSQGPDSDGPGNAEPRVFTVEDGKGGLVGVKERDGEKKRERQRVG